MPFAAYLNFATDHRRFLSFGFVLAFASSFGQTFFIGLFGPDIQQTFDLSKTEWGAIYMVGTLASAAVFAWTGKLIDRVDLRVYSLTVCGLLALACFGLALVNSLSMLIVVIFLLRQAGQGLASHVAMTSMARYFEAGRGRAIALASLGFAAGEALLPIIAVLAITAFGWRWTYAGVGLIIAGVFLPAVAWLLANHPARHQAYLQELRAQNGDHNAHGQGWTRRTVMRDSRFLMVLPGVVAPPLILTGLFFHHLTLADAKGWSYAWITGSYGFYAGAGILASLLAGRLVDRFGAASVLPFMLPPLATGLLLIAWLDAPWVAWPYLCLLGISTGLLVAPASALWAELYGSANLGAIRSLVTALNVFASALGPVILGGLMDRGLSIEFVCVVFAGYALVGTVLISIALRRVGSPQAHHTGH
ncbi:MAG: MFS transporter [Gammaproteobacteria bacterium]